MVKKSKKLVSPQKSHMDGRGYFKTGINGLDAMFEFGIPNGSAILLAGGTGSGKTMLCLNAIANIAKSGRKCLYMTFEETEEALREHMEQFGWKPRELEQQGFLAIKRLNLFDVSRTIEGMLGKLKGEVTIDIKPLILPRGFMPEFVVVDSLTAIASTFMGKEQNYRIFIEQLFRFFEGLRATSFLITETEEYPQKFSPTGIEEFLADGVIVLYHFRKGADRIHALEVVKMRGSWHTKKVVIMDIDPKRGIIVYPNKQAFVIKD